MKRATPSSISCGHPRQIRSLKADAIDKLPVMVFESGEELRAWLMINHGTSDGIWVRIFKKDSRIKSVTFEEVLDQGLCFGWSESMRRKGDESSYLQRFTPRRTQGTASRRNREHIERLIKERKMTPAGLEAAGIKS
jgi:uncharacterized protein YdeI (YjbR/CyaY-like superfamily)